MSALAIGARAIALGLALALPRISVAQEPPETPQSLLPELFDEAPGPAASGPQMPVPIVPDGSVQAPTPPPPVAALPPIPQQAPIELVDPLAGIGGPEGQPELMGLLTPRNGGYAPDLFAGSDARFLARLLTGIEAPLASRWAQVMVQRALLSRTLAPPGLDPADWLAARGEALVMMGAAADAHRMLSRIALDRFTARLYAVAGGAALAAADPVGLCPLAIGARAETGLPVWTLTDGMCAGLTGDDFGASMRFDALRDRRSVNSFDVGLAERISAFAGGGRRAANPEWDEAGGLTAWRIGLASAAGLAIPDDLVAAATPAQRAWMVRLAGQGITRRAALAPEAAGLGVISGAELERILAAEAASLDQGAVARSPGGALRTARTAGSPAERVAAMRSLWRRAPAGTASGFGWLAATATAAAGIVPAPGLADDAPELVASMLAVGLVGEARRWWNALEDAPRGPRAAVHVQLAAADPSLAADPALVEAWAKEAPAHRSALVRAGLEGLGQLPAGGTTALDNPWTRAMDRAVAGRRLGEVMLLAASAMQAGWAHVPPDHLRRIAAGLASLGAGAEAGLIVAEAATRG